MSGAPVEKRRKIFMDKCEDRLEHFHDYEFLSEYKNQREKMKVKHLVCEYEYEIAPSNFLAGYKCPKCAGRVVTNEIVQERMDSIHGKGIVVLEDNYVNNKTHMNMKHSVCGRNFKARFDNLSRGHACPHCAHNSDSIGVRKIRDILDRNNILYDEERTFTGLRSYRGFELKMDFYIHSLKLCIEFDGEQHFKPTRYNDAQEKFEALQKNDKIKNEYFENSAIDLVRFDYNELRRREIDDKLLKIIKERSTTIL